jgi:hypothetical protein
METEAVSQQAVHNDQIAAARKPFLNGLAISVTLIALGVLARSGRIGFSEESTNGVMIVAAVVSVITIGNFLDYRATVNPTGPWRILHAASALLIHFALAIGGIAMTAFYLPSTVMFLTAIGAFNGFWPHSIMQSQLFWSVLVATAAMSVLLSAFGAIALTIKRRPHSSKATETAIETLADASFQLHGRALRLMLWLLGVCAVLSSVRLLITRLL